MMLVSDLIEKIRLIADEYPEYVYVKTGDYCQYYPTSENPHGCIVGFAARQLECNLDDKEYQDVPFYVIVNYRGDISGSQQEVNWVRRVQGNQDNGMSWKQAVKEADRVYGNISS